MLRAIEADKNMALRLLVCGMHLSPTFGMTVTRIEEDAIPIAERIETQAEGDTAHAAAESMAAGIAGFSRSFAQQRPDLVMVAGDRPEMLAAAAAALLHGIPVAHLHGGELTYGAVDDAIRHALTKMSHIHFTATEDYARRVIQMGEDPARVHVTGGPGLDNLHAIELMEPATLAQEIGMAMDPAPLLCTFHPVTLEAADTLNQLDAMLGAIEETGLPAVFTFPNADPEGRRIIAALKDFVRAGDSRALVPDLGTRAYFSLMACAAAMVGNSSSGITEAASFRLPVVNIGLRQGGRTRAANIIDVEPVKEKIRAAIATAISPAFRVGLAGLVNPYGDGHAAEKIVRVLRETPLDAGLTIKRFRDIDAVV